MSMTHEDLKRIDHLAWEYDLSTSDSHGLLQDLRNGKFPEIDLKRAKEIAEIVKEKADPNSVRAVEMRRYVYDTLVYYLVDVLKEESDLGSYFDCPEDEQRAKEAMRLLEDNDDIWEPKDTTLS